MREEELFWSARFGAGSRSRVGLPVPWTRVLVLLHDARARPFSLLYFNSVTPIFPDAVAHCAFFFWKVGVLWRILLFRKWPNEQTWERKRFGRENHSGDRLCHRRYPRAGGIATAHARRTACCCSATRGVARATASRAAAPSSSRCPAAATCGHTDSGPFDISADAAAKFDPHTCGRFPTDFRRFGRVVVYPRWLDAVARCSQHGRASFGAASVEVSLESNAHRRISAYGLCVKCSDRRDCLAAEATATQLRRLRRGSRFEAAGATAERVGNSG